MHAVTEIVNPEYNTDRAYADIPKINWVYVKLLLNNALI